MTLHLYDGLAVIRRKIENDALGRAPRTLVTEMISTIPGDVHVWAFEGQDHLAARRALLPGYKVRPSTFNDGFWEILGLVQDALKHTNAIQVRVPGFEADDVIGNIACQHAGKQPIVVHTVDRDLKQLEALPGVRVEAANLEGVEPQYVRLYKTYVGDTSDKVPGAKGFGEKAWENCSPVKLYAAHHDLLAGHEDPETFEDAGIPARLAISICKPEQAELLRTYWKVVGFLPIEEDVLAKHMTAGRPDYAAADALLKEFRH